MNSSDDMKECLRENVRKAKNEVFSCLTCPKVYGFKNQLRNHRCHRQKLKRLVTCDICSITVIAQNLRAHMDRKHLNEYAFTCNLCDRKFSHAIYLKVHVDNIHLNRYKMYCEVCKRGFNFPNELDKHRKFEHEGARHFCKECPKIFKDRGRFKIHVASHDPDYVEPVYECPECDQSFKQKHSYNKHLRKHGGEKFEYVCETCGRITTTKTSLREHILIHTGEKPHKCEVCGKSFNKKCLLMTHFRLHTNEKPYECTVCEKTFTQKPALNVHMKYHTGKNLHECEVCGKKYVTKYMLKKHKCKGPVENNGNIADLKVK